VSPKNHSLAVDEEKNFQDIELEAFRQPELKILINNNLGGKDLSSEEVIKVQGKITISF
jgi:hypothetical protein